MEKKILYDSDEAAKILTATGWVSRRGHYWGQDEHMARWDGCTHQKCECGEIMTKHYTKCKSCRTRISNKKYDAKEKIEWDGETPLCLHDSDEFFFSYDDIEYYCDSHGLNINDLRLLLCSPLYPPILDAADFILSDMPDGVDDVPDNIIKIAASFNEAVAQMGPVAWEATSQPVKITGPF